MFFKVSSFLDLNHCFESSGTNTARLETDCLDGTLMGVEPSTSEPTPSDPSCQPHHTEQGKDFIHSCMCL
ncbi:hypothetical protein M8J76_001162 [Diaphorina citri]|nr:hypothetical protein M8J75_004028 [Diaphorina citri]KAI5729301.1 hypothetical protein M8J76_001162 [Diaphorina citri]